VAIVLLLAVTVALGYYSGAFSGLLTRNNALGNTESVIPNYTASEAARPIAIVFTDDDGVRTAAQYDTALRDTLYERTRGTIGAAVAYAGSAETCDETEWREALVSSGVYYEYSDELPIAVICGWLGNTAPDLKAGGLTRRAALRFDNKTLYFSTDSGFTKYVTAQFGEKPSIPETAAVRVNFAFETDEKSPSPYTLLFGNSVFPRYAVQNPLSETNTGAVLTELGVPPGLQPSYSDSEGTQVYVTGAFSLSLSTGGAVAYRLFEEPTEYERLPLGDSVEIARRAVFVGDLAAGSARLYCVGAEYDGERTLVYFDYFVGGGRVYLNADHAATIELRGSTIVAKNIVFREFMPTTADPTALLPIKQSIAAASGEVQLAYAETGDGIAVPYWREVRL
jgi:hypothetical protein